MKLRILTLTEDSQIHLINTLESEQSRLDAKLERLNRILRVVSHIEAPTEEEQKEITGVLEDLGETSKQFFMNSALLVQLKGGKTNV